MFKSKKIIFIIIVFIILSLLFFSVKVEGKSLSQIKTEYPNGDTWSGGGECNGFAQKMYYEFYGINPAFFNTQKDTLDDIEPGDIVRYTYNGTDKHSVWITGRDGDTVSIGEANYDNANTIRWTTKNINEFEDLDYVYKAPYRLDRNAPIMDAPTNITATPLPNGIDVSWSAVDNASGYIIKVYKKSDVYNGNYSNPVATKTIENTPEHNYNNGTIELSQEGEYSVFVHSKLGYIVSSTGGMPATVMLKNIKELELELEKTTLVIGETCNVTAKYKPEDANLTEINIISTDNTVATYNSNTKSIVAKKVGVTTIKATSINGETTSININVINGTPVSRFELNFYSKEIKVGERVQIIPSNFYPEDATFKTASFTSLNEDIVSVDENGFVTGLEEGTGRINVKSGNYTLGVSFTVTPGTKISELNLDREELNLFVGTKEQLTPTITPEDATNKIIEWESTNDNIVTVDSNGIVSAVSAGQAIITARTTDGSDLSKSCIVNVTDEEYDPTQKMSLNYSIYQFDQLGSTMQLKALLTNGKVTNVTWESSNTNILTVDSDGIVTAVRGGFAYVYANSEYYGICSCWIYVSCPVTLSDGSNVYVGDIDGNGVFDANDQSLILEMYRAGKNTKDDILLADIDNNGIIDANDGSLISEIYKIEIFKPGNFATIRYVTIDKTNVELLTEDTVQLHAFVTPTNTQQSKTITWTSNNEEIAIVDENGTVTAVGVGTATITATSSNGKTSTCTVKVFQKIPLIGLSINKTTLTLSIDEEFTLRAIYNPSNTTDDKTVTWSSDKEDIVTVDENGKVKALKEGNATITVKNDNLIGICKVNVIKPLVNISLNKTEITINKGETEELVVSFNPEDTNIDKTITWLSTNPNIASVDENGVVTANGKGIATISAKVGTATANCIVTVKVPITEVNLNRNDITMNMGESDNLIVTYNPQDTTDDTTATWISTNPEVASVDSTGKVVALQEGETTIKAKIANIEASCKITVNNPIISVYLNKSSTTLKVDETETLVLTYEPKNATYDNSITWTSSNNEVATVDNTGKVTAIKEGKAIIYGKIGNKSASCTVWISNSMPIVNYRTHIESIGWVNYAKDGEMCGTTGHSLRLEGINIFINNTELSGNIEYSTHIQNIGWQDFVKNGEKSGTEGQSLRLEAIKIRLTGELEENYDIYYRVHCENFGWLGWAKNGEKAGTSGYGLRLEAIEIRLVHKGESAPGKTDNKFYKAPANVNYRTHVQDIGWQDYVKNGEVSGTEGQSLRLEAINITVDNTDLTGNIEYSTHIQNIGWKDFVKDGELSGTEGQSLRLEAIKIRLTGELEENYDVYYRVHCENFGWLDWAKNGEEAGSSGYGYRLEAIEIKLIKKGESAPGKTDNKFYKAPANVNYRTHVQDIGWQDYVKNGEVSGTEGQSLRLEAINIIVDNTELKGDIEYSTHVQNIGWQDFVKNDETAGTEGQSLRLEAIKIRLTGELEENYDVYYRVHCENFGWLGWTKNGEEAGSTGYGYRLEAIEIKLLKKGEAFTEENNKQAFMNNYN